MPREDEKEKEPSDSRLLFARRLKEERKKRGWTQEKLGEEADLSWNYIGQVERGGRNISIDNMDRLAKALKLPLADLLRDPAPAKDQSESSDTLPAAKEQAGR